MHDTLIASLILLGGALVLGALAERLRQTAVLGYLLAGTLVGPGVLGLVRAEAGVSVLAELGAATLLFSIGTEFSLARLRSLGRRTFVLGVVQVLATLVAVMAIARLAGLDGRAAFTTGAVVSLSSTAVVMRLLIEGKVLDSGHGRMSMGVLLTQDLAVVPLVIVVTLLAGDATPAHAATELARTAGWAVLLVAAFVVLVRWVAPLFLAGRGMTRNRELVAVFATVWALGSALGADAVGLSPALGAFVAGVLLGSSHFATQVRAELAPLRTILITLFFAAVGLAGDPMWAWAHADRALVVIVGMILVKAAVTTGAARLIGVAPVTALATGLCIAQIGEFSFVIAQVARAGGIIGEELHRLLVTSTIGTLALSPLLVSLARRVVRARVGASLAGGPVGNSSRSRVLLIGFGKAGHCAFEELPKARRPDVTVIEMNPALADLARACGATVHVGDAGRLDVLEHAGARSARVVAITTADVDAASHVVSLVRALAPDAFVVVRARYRVVAADLRRSGAHLVVDEEALVGDRLAAAIEGAMRSFG
jgi:CPA2 family monovalent cation:H+ antiporter-2